MDRELVGWIDRWIDKMHEYGMDGVIGECYGRNFGSVQFGELGWTIVF